MPILSHPHLRLSEHISQIVTAMEGMWETWHSPLSTGDRLKDVCREAARYHDLGKGTTAFQAYIVDPGSYRGDRDEKSHTALSFLCTALIAEAEKWDPLKTLLLTAIIKSHHSGFPLLEELCDIGGGETAKLLKRQCSIFLMHDLQNEVDIPLDRQWFQERPWARIKRFFDRMVLPDFQNLPIEKAVQFRLETQLAYSFLLEADKAFLAVPDAKLHLGRLRHDFSPAWVTKKIGAPDQTPVNHLRTQAREEVLRELEQLPEARLFSLTAPTGIGKTLLGASWAFRLREQIGKKGEVLPKIILVLPFLSIIDQTSREYEKILKQGCETLDGSWFLTSHSLSDRQYSGDLEDKTEAFFIDTWRTELVITTYDQFLFCLMDSSAKHQMRFHNLCDALVVFDEVQSLPCCLWKPFGQILTELSRLGNSRFLFMSATMPPFIPGLKSLLPNYQEMFRQCNRYTIALRLKKSKTLLEFADEIHERVPKWVKNRKKVMITLNTRASARFVRETVEKALQPYENQIPLLFLTADVAPVDRLKSIHSIRESPACIVVTTQCVEAGVDIDMDMIIRDFAPFDSIVQIAGRCNRNGMKEMGKVEIVVLITEKGRRYAEMIYHAIHLQETWRLVENVEKLEEQEILHYSDSYFSQLMKTRDLGDKHLERFARWQADESVKALLRGYEGDQVSLIVAKLDPDLRAEMAKLSRIIDRWDRREAWRKLAGRIARVSISVYARKGFEPLDIADEACGHLFLRDQFYDSQRGLMLPDDKEENGCRIL